MEVSFFKDMKMAVFKPRQFVEQRFLQVPHSRIERLGNSCMFLGLVLGNILILVLAMLAATSFSQNPEIYSEALKSLNLEAKGFLELISMQKAYSILLIVLSPLICYMAPHIYGGVLFLLLWIAMPLMRQKLDFFRVMDIASFSFCALLFYLIPIIGPPLAIILLAINTSRALEVSYQMTGFIKIVCVILAVYFCFFLSAGTLQLVASLLSAWF